MLYVRHGTSLKLSLQSLIYNILKIKFAIKKKNRNMPLPADNPIK